MFTSIEKFEHGDYPTAAKLNALLDNLDSLNVRLWEGRLPARDTSRNVFVNRCRFLWYNGSGSITDVSEPTNTISLSSDTVTRFDLTSVSWMAKGKLYIALNFDYSLESSQ